jgi:adenylate kinase family enzyme
VKRLALSFQDLTLCQPEPGLGDELNLFFARSLIVLVEGCSRVFRSEGRCPPTGRPSRYRCSDGGGVPLLTAADALPRRPQRILVAGTSGSGKTTLAARICEQLGVRHVEIDALFHGPGWTPREAFVADVDEFSAAPSWVTEWQYSAVRARLAERADLVVWLDLSRATVMRQVVQRTLRRRLRRHELWNGNIEPPLWTVFSHRDHIVRWAWSTYHTSVQRIADLQQQRPDLVIVRLRDRHGVQQWINGPLRRAATLPTSPA